MILLHDGPCIVVNKPGGIPTQAPPGIESMERHVRDYVRDCEQLRGNFYLGVPHRLDRPASGVLVFTRHARAAKRISQQFERREVRKRYWVLLEGHVEPQSGNWEDSLYKLPNQAHVITVPRDHPQAKLAALRYEVLERTNEISWLQIELLTGRMHQIRVQAAARGVPVVGDAEYGSRCAFGPAVEDPRRRGIALHAREIAFRHPMEDRIVDVTAPLPSSWQQFEGPITFA